VQIGALVLGGENKRARQPNTTDCSRQTESAARRSAWRNQRQWTPFQLGDLWRSRSMASSWSARAGVFNDKMLRLAKAISGPARLHVFCHPSMGVGAPTVKRRTRLVGRAEAWRRSGGDPKPQSHQTGPPALGTACVPHAIASSSESPSGSISTPAMCPSR